MLLHNVNWEEVSCEGKKPSAANQSHLAKYVFIRVSLDECGCLFPLSSFLHLEVIRWTSIKQDCSVFLSLRLQYGWESAAYGVGVLSLLLWLWGRKWEPYRASESQTSSSLNDWTWRNATGWGKSWTFSTGSLSALSCCVPGIQQALKVGGVSGIFFVCVCWVNGCLGYVFISWYVSNVHTKIVISILFEHLAVP